MHDDDDFDEHGILKDGRSFRTSLTLMDSLDPLQRSIAHSVRVTDGDGGTQGLHRPGFRIADARKRTTHYDPKGRMRGYSETQIEEEDEDKRDAARDAAYATYSRDLVTAWRGGDAGNDKPLTRDEAYETYLQDVTTAWRGKGQTSATETPRDHRSVQQTVQDHQTNMERLYQARDRELSEAWRLG